MEKTDWGTLFSIQVHCRKLTSVQICFAIDVWQAHTDLLVSYGSQLKDVGFSISSGPFPPDLVEKVISTCPNVRCTLSFIVERDSRMVRAMAYHVDAIRGNFRA